jgi:DNA-binding NarL/FixJ family response regulator
MLHVLPDGFQGLANKEVASALDLAVETVRTYRKTLMKKLNVHNVALPAMEKGSGIVPNPNSN